MDKDIVWQPTAIENTRMWHFMRFVEARYQQTFADYQALYQWSIHSPGDFWDSVRIFFNLAWDSEPTRVLNNYEDFLAARFFEGATLNVAHILLHPDYDAHIALISLDEQGHTQHFTYKALRQAVMACAKGLETLGVTEGCRVVGIMPNSHFTVIAFLACASIGAIWASCSTDFGARAAYDRLGQIEPTVLFTSNSHQYQGKVHDDIEKAVELCKLIPSIKHTIICPVLTPLKLSTPSTDDNTQFHWWDDFIKPTKDMTFTPFPFSHPLYILFSSGTTGKPKCIIHSAGGSLLQQVKELGLHTDIKSHDNLFFYTTCGWMMWNWMVSVLSLGATLTLYEGSPTYPDGSTLFHIIEKHQVSVFGTSAKFISTVEKLGINLKQSVDLSSLRCILSTGSPLLPKNYDYVYQSIKSDVQLCSISGGTDIVSCFALGNPILPVYRGELQSIGLGMAVTVVDDEGKPIVNQCGELVCTQPFPSMPVGFWNDPDNKLYRHAYFERFRGIWAHGDFAKLTLHGGLIIYGRSDAVLNPGGVRIGTAEIYRQVETIPEIMDSVVIAQEWQDDVRIVLFVKLKPEVTLTPALAQTIQHTIRSNTTPRHVPAKILQVAEIPRTLSGKTVELAVRQAVHGQEIKNLSSLANPEALEGFRNRPELGE